MPGSFTPSSALTMRVRKPFRPSSWIHEYAPMNGGERYEMTMRMLMRPAPRIFTLRSRYAIGTPMSDATSVDTIVTLKLLTRAPQ